MDQDLRQKGERLKILAEEFLKNNIRVFVVDLNNEWYFADILLVGDDKLTIQCFSPEKKKNQKFYLRWIEIVKMEEYRR